MKKNFLNITMNKIHINKVVFEFQKQLHREFRFPEHLFSFELKLVK
jgi:hypothetical protein